ncbi:glycosyltransferase family 2 protein [Agromyces allii]|uniref:Glycosyltransferase 2-like domain-containing protein n=1 Tax=Agromyces allii TaxID=393607 RepID=A0ABN2Q4K1_9MICO|nr:glycosyltransferase family 2 protein [Agromyces allii]
MIPTKNVERYIDACLASVLGQSYWRVEVIVVDDASTDRTRSKLARWVSKDSRVQVFDVDVSDPNAARNFGIERARGEYVTFLDGDDVLLAGAYRDLIASLRATGSDFVVGSYDRLVGGRRTPAAFWIDEAHRVDRPGTTVQAFPDIMVNAVQWTKLYVRRFWDEAGLRFPEGGHFQDQIVSASAYSRASRFDVASRRIVAWRIRLEGTSMTQQTVSPRQVSDRFGSAAAALAIVRAEAGADVAEERLIQFLSNDVAIAAAQLPGMGDEACRALRAGLLALAPPIERRAVWDRVPAESKVLYALLIAGDEARARAYVEQGGLDLLAHELVVVDGRTYVTLPFWDDQDAALPLAWFQAAPRELRAFEHARSSAH